MQLPSGSTHLLPDFSSSAPSLDVCATSHATNFAASPALGYLFTHVGLCNGIPLGTQSHTIAGGTAAHFLASAPHVLRPQPRSHHPRGAFPSRTCSTPWRSVEHVDSKSATERYTCPARARSRCHVHNAACIRAAPGVAAMVRPAAGPSWVMSTVPRGTRGPTPVPTTAVGVCHAPSSAADYPGSQW